MDKVWGFCPFYAVKEFQFSQNLQLTGLLISYLCFLSEIGVSARSSVGVKRQILEIRK